MMESLRSGRWLTPERLRIYPAILLAVSILALILLAATARNGVDRFGHMLGPDFTEIWAAGQEVRDGHPRDAYDVKLHHARQDELFGPSADFYLWSYPPYFLGVAGLLALFPYLTALVLWQAATLALYLAAMVPILRRAGLSWPQALIPALAYPAVFVNLAHGQNGFLTTALLAGAILCIEKRPLLAGALFAMLAYKPQFAVMVPVALIAAGYWRVIFSGIATLSLLTLATLAGFGTTVWLSFADGLGAAKAFVLNEGGAGYDKMQSLFAAARLAGASLEQAYTVQALSALLTSAALFWLWRSSADMRLKGAALLTSALLVTPYSFDYDLMILAPAMALSFAYGRDKGFAPYEQTLLTCLWIAPLIARPLATATSIPVGALLVLLFFLLLLQRGRRGSLAPTTAAPLASCTVTLREG